MRIFRLNREKYGRKLSGAGAAISGNRWNSKGTEIIYCAESRALAVAEIMVHLSYELLPPDYLMLEIDIPKSVSQMRLGKKSLPEGWNSFPHRKATRTIGDQFITKMNACVLKVPSAVVPGDSNYLINPAHPDFNSITLIEAIPFPFDQRFFST